MDFWGYRALFNGNNMLLHTWLEDEKPCSAKSTGTMKETPGRTTPGDSVWMEMKDLKAQF